MRLHAEKWFIDPNLGHLLPEGVPEQCARCPVRAISFCADLAPGELARLDAITAELRLEPQQALLYEGDEALHAYNVTSGVLRLIKMLPDGRRQIIGFLFPGDFVGMANRGSYAYSAEAITPVRLCRYHRARLFELGRDVPKLEARFLAIATEELAAAQEQMLLLGRKTARERVASFLVAMREHAIKRGAQPDPIELPMARTDIADYLGLTIETVSRTITRLQREGIIRLESPNRIECRDGEALAAIDAGEGTA